MPESSKNIAIGILVSCGIALVVWVLIFLHPHFGDGQFKLHARFTDIEKIAVGSRVTYAGRPVGEVVAITSISQEERSLGSEEDPIYCYDLTLAIDSHLTVYTSDEITLGTSGLMGERFIQIIPRRSSEKPRILTSDDIVNAQDNTTMADTFSEISNVAAKAEKTIEDLANLLKENREEFQQTLHSIKGASKSLDHLLKQTTDQNVVQGIKKSAEQLEKTLSAAEKTMNELQESQIVPKLATTVSNLEQITTSLNRPEDFKKILASTQKAMENFEKTSEQVERSWPKIVSTLDNVSTASIEMHALGQKANKAADEIGNLIATVSAGEGSLGKLMVSDDFYFKTLSCMNKIETMMNDVNHYGVLFHLDKGWQRDRRARIADLERLKDPKDFQKYLDDEMAKINTALSRVGLAAEKAQNLENKGDFSRTYSDLLTQLESLQGNLKNYSTLIADQEKLDK